MIYKMIVAVDEKGGIGKDNKIPWHYLEDMKYFTRITIGTEKNTIIMGRKTWDSLPKKPLPKRINIVISKEGYSKRYCDVLSKLYLENWVIGGAQIYNMFLPETTQIYLTKIPGDYNCDTFFNMKYLEKNFELKEEFKKDELIFCVYNRK